MNGLVIMNLVFATMHLVILGMSRTPTSTATSAVYLVIHVALVSICWDEK